MKKKLKITFNAPVVLVFSLISLIATILNMMTDGKSNELVFMTYHSPLSDPLTYVRFFTHVLGHQGFEHYIGNMAYILLLGPFLEEKYGSKKVLEIIAITAFVTGLVNYIFFVDVALCGASGVVFAFILLMAFSNMKEGELPITAILVALIFIGQQVYEGFFLSDNVSNISHIIGGIIGVLVGYNISRKPKY